MACCTEYRRELSESTVDENQIRLSQVLFPSVAPGDHLFHAGEIIGAFDGLNLESPVIRLLHLPIFPDNHRRDGLVTHGIGDIEAFDSTGRVVQSQ